MRVSTSNGTPTLSRFVNTEPDGTLPKGGLPRGSTYTTALVETAGTLPKGGLLTVSAKGETIEFNTGDDEDEWFQVTDKDGLDNWHREGLRYAGTTDDTNTPTTTTMAPPPHEHSPPSFTLPKLLFSDLHYEENLEINNGAFITTVPTHVDLPKPVWLKSIWTNSPEAVPHKIVHIPHDLGLVTDKETADTLLSHAAACRQKGYNFARDSCNDSDQTNGVYLFTGNALTLSYVIAFSVSESEYLSNNIARMLSFDTYLHLFRLDSPTHTFQFITDCNRVDTFHGLILLSCNCISEKYPLVTHIGVMFKAPRHVRISTFLAGFTLFTTVSCDTLPQGGLSLETAGHY